MIDAGLQVGLEGAGGPGSACSPLRGRGVGVRITTPEFAVIPPPPPPNGEGNPMGGPPCIAPPLRSRCVDC